MKDNIKTFAYPSPEFESWWKEKLVAQQGSDVTEKVRELIEAVKSTGEEALLNQIERYDGWRAEDATGLIVQKEDFKTFAQQIDQQTLKDFQLAAERITAFHERDKPSSWEFTDETGMILGKKYTAIESCMAYAPGGKAFYPSSVLMNLIPATIAGVKRKVLATPCPNGQLNPLVAMAASLAGADEIWMVGGVGAVAAACYGTASLNPVNLITGPGNIWFSTAKKLVFGEIGIDMIAGPSEILIIADPDQPAELISQDLLAQAEHDELSSAILISTSAKLLDRVAEQINVEIQHHPRRKILEESIRNNSALILVQDFSQGCKLANVIAPEHLQISMENPELIIDDIHHAGAIFIGSQVAEVLGDYVAGSNHVLPTAGSAKFSSPLGVQNFMKATNIIGMDQARRAGAKELWASASRMAELEGLYSHKKSARIRLGNEN